MRSLDIDLEKVKYLKEFWTNNEIYLINGFDLDKLKKYYKTALNRYDWEFINKETVFEYCLERLKNGI